MKIHHLIFCAVFLFSGSALAANCKANPAKLDVLDNVVSNLQSVLTERAAYTSDHAITHHNREHFLEWKQRFDSWKEQAKARASDPVTQNDLIVARYSNCVMTFTDLTPGHAQEKIPSVRLNLNYHS